MIFLEHASLLPVQSAGFSGFYSLVLSVLSVSTVKHSHQTNSQFLFLLSCLQQQTVVCLQGHDESHIYIPFRYTH